MSPAKVSPVVARRVILVKRMVRTIKIDKPVRVVDPVTRRLYCSLYDAATGPSFSPGVSGDSVTGIGGWSSNGDVSRHDTESIIAGTVTAAINILRFIIDFIL